MIYMIYASANHGIIGRNNRLPWKDKEEMQHFKDTTIGKTVVMGYNTWLSIGSKPLPNRNNIVYNNRETPLILEGATVMTKSELDELLSTTDSDIFLIGGTKVFNDFYKHVDYVYHSVYKKFVYTKITCNVIYFNLHKLIPDCKLDKSYKKELTNFTVYKYITPKRLDVQGKN